MKKTKGLTTMMKKMVMMIMVCAMCIGAVTAEASRYDVPVNGKHSLVFLKCHVLRRDKGNPDEGLNLYYDSENKALYVSVHGDTDGSLRGVYAPYNMMQYFDYWFSLNSDLLSGLEVRELYLIACHAEARARKVHLGRSKYFGVTMKEFGYSQRVVTETWKSWNDGKCHIMIVCEGCAIHRDKNAYKRAKAGAPAWGKSLIKNYIKQHR